MPRLERLQLHPSQMTALRFKRKVTPCYQCIGGGWVGDRNRCCHGGTLRLHIKDGYLHENQQTYKDHWPRNKYSEFVHVLEVNEWFLLTHMTGADESIASMQGWSSRKTLAGSDNHIQTIGDRSDRMDSVPPHHSCQANHSPYFHMKNKVSQPMTKFSIFLIYEQSLQSDHGDRTIDRQIQGYPGMAGWK